MKTTFPLKHTFITVKTLDTAKSLDKFLPMILIDFGA